MPPEATMIPVNEPLLAGHEAEYVLDCVRTGWISSAGEYLRRFEEGWAAYCGRRHGVAVCNGLSRLRLDNGCKALPPRQTAFTTR